MGLSQFKTKTGWLCLDFTNTVDWHASSNPEESLTNYPRLVGWAKDVGLVSAIEEKKLLGQAEEKPDEARRTLERAIELREAIYHIMAGLAHDMPPRPSDLAIMNQSIADMMAHTKLLLDKGGGFIWGWSHDQESMDFMLWPVVHSATELLTSDALRRVGQCADERGCGWLFMDTSKNRTRRWCSMGDCGNRAKARRHYEKQRVGSRGK